MYLRFARRRKDGKEHRYWSIVESRRCAGGRVVQRPVLYLGEINDSQRAAWCRVIEAFDEGSGRYRQLALFPAERSVPDQATGFALQVRLLVKRAAREKLTGIPARKKQPRDLPRNTMPIVADSSWQVSRPDATASAWGVPPGPPGESSIDRVRRLMQGR
jgi:hypothetical protein